MSSLVFLLIISSHSSKAIWPLRYNIVRVKKTLLGERTKEQDSMKKKKTIDDSFNFLKIIVDREVGRWKSV